MQNGDLCGHSSLTRQALHPYQISRQHVDLEIDHCAYRQLAQRRHFGGVRDDVEGEVAGAVLAVADVVDGSSWCRWISLRCMPG